MEKGNGFLMVLVGTCDFICQEEISGTNNGSHEEPASGSRLIPEKGPAGPLCSVCGSGYSGTHGCDFPESFSSQGALNETEIV